MNDHRGSKFEAAPEEVVWVELSVERARDLDEVLSTVNAKTQVATMREAFRQSEMVCGVWPDATSPAGHCYMIMKNPPKSLMRRHLRDGTLPVFMAILCQNKTEAALMKRVYDLGIENPKDQRTADYCSAVWLDMAPASRAARARAANALDR